MLTETDFRRLQENQARAAGVDLPVKRKRPTYRSKTEARYAQYLSLLSDARQIRGWEYEPITFKLGFDTRYTPDFLVTTNDGFEFHEVKGVKDGKCYSRPLGKVKVRVAAAMFPMFRFVMVWPATRGEWNKDQVQI